MTGTAIATDDVVDFIHAAWRRHDNEKKRRKWPRDTKWPGTLAVRAAFDCAYVASLLQEEARPVTFQLLLGSPNDVNARQRRAKPVGGEPDPLIVLPFSGEQPLTPQAVRRLAPATDPRRTFIGVANAARSKDGAGEMAIWGLVDIGTSWWEFSRHEAQAAFSPPEVISLSSTQAATITASLGGHRILRYKMGQLLYPSPDVFYSDGPISTFIAVQADELRAATVAKHGAPRMERLEKYGTPPYAHYVRALKILLQAVVDARHGGTVIVVPDDFGNADERLLDRVILKHASPSNEIWTALQELIDAEIEGGEWHDRSFKAPADKPRRILDTDHAFQRRETACRRRLSELLRLAARLAAVDGALVISDRFRLIGFAGEVIVPSQTITHTLDATTADGSQGTPRSILDFGTRHRSAMRFCSSLESALAFVVSQDGGLKAVKRSGGRLVMWSDLSLEEA